MPDFQLALETLIWHHQIMSSISGTKKTRGRPRVDSVSIHLRLPPAECAAFDSWLESKNMSRQEAARLAIKKMTGAI